MSSIPTPDASTIEHPVWCHREQCETTDGDVRHVSRAVRCTSKDGTVEVWLVRTDELAFPDEPGGHEIAVQLVCTAVDQSGINGARVYFEAAGLVVTFRGGHS